MLRAKFYKLLQTVTKIKINEFSIVCSNHKDSFLNGGAQWRKMEY